MFEKYYKSSKLNAILNIYVKGSLLERKNNLLFYSFLAYKFL
jgi:hypothetical protein